jgi:hypothetical protein
MKRERYRRRGKTDRPPDLRGGSMNFNQTFLTDLDEIDDISPPQDHPSVIIETVEF